MKDIYKNPILYYILVPFIVSLWPLLIWTVYLPKVQSDWQKEKEQYTKAQKIMDQILTLDPGRLELVDSNTGTVEFDYTTVVDKIAGLCNITVTNYTIDSNPARISKGQKSQNAKVVLKDVDITKFAKFLSAIQFRWPDLQCESAIISRQKGVRDSWKVGLDFKYYY